MAKDSLEESKRVTSRQKARHFDSVEFRDKGLSEAVEAAGADVGMEGMEILAVNRSAGRSRDRSRA